MLPALSVRIAELARRKDRTGIAFERLCALARDAGFRGLSLRPSIVSIDSSAAHADAVRACLDAHGLRAAMVTGALSLATNDAEAPRALSAIGPHLDLAERVGARLVRVMLHDETDVASARAAADVASQRGIALSHQCHWGSLCETVDECLGLVERVGRANFGITLEPANLLACGDPVTEAGIRRLAPYLLNVYFQNMRLDPLSDLVFPTRRQGPVGVRYAALADRSAIDAHALVRALRSAGYDGWFTVHQPVLADQTVEDAVGAAGDLTRALRLA